MSRNPSQEQLLTTNKSETNETLEIIREEQCSPALSSVNMTAVSKKDPEVKPCVGCTCAQDLGKVNDEDSGEIKNILLQQETTLRKEFQVKLETEIDNLKEKFDFILRNEQVRASYMLREAHRERQEKINALQTQLECKNLAGLMFVLCAERRKSELEKLRLIEEYTSYIRALQHILSEGQDLILHLSRGYKTAARVDQEWRQKMISIINQFQAYIVHFSGGTPESNQYLFDLPALLKTEAAIQPNPEEYPCEIEEEEQEPVLLRQSSEDNKPWYETLEGDCRPFVMFGDMAEFMPPERRVVLKAVKAAKTAPKHWKEYVFNDMFLRANCSNANVIKDEYVNRFPPMSNWECVGVQTDRQYSKTSIFSNRRMTTPSIDVRGNMGSILKIITNNSITQANTKSTLLGARDSMEIASSTKVREKHRESHPCKVVINIGDRNVEQLNVEEEENCVDNPSKEQTEQENEVGGEEEVYQSISLSRINDSLQVVSQHVPVRDKINYEKVCPMEACQRMEMDSFVRSLPAYMRNSPFMHFEYTYDNYEICSPEQLEILKQRIEQKTKKEKTEHTALDEDPLQEWSLGVAGVAVQTSEESLPPCTCIVPSPTPVSSTGRIFNLEDLIPIKQTMNEIRKECFFDADIEFDRFRVIGEESKDDFRCINGNEDFTKTRLNEIKKILKRHPSLCDIFQANTQC